MDCENCENEHGGTYGSGRFCSSKCARGFSTKEKRSLINEKVSKTLTLNKRGNCNSCNCEIDKKIKYCKECKKYSSYKTMFSKLNINEDNFQFANKLALNILSDLYFNKRYSKYMIYEEFGINTNTLYNYFNKNGIILRSITESLVNAYKEERLKLNNNITYSKAEWHKTWNNKNVYLRSSYEKDFANNLDNQKIDYEVENLKIEYFDTKSNTYRISIPDFFIPESNTIVEIKSTYTLDKTNMRDKRKSYIENGYNFKLILDKNEISLNDLF
jgi:hypothetical protein